MIYFQFAGIIKMNFEDFAFYCQTILKEKKKKYAKFTLSWPSHILSNNKEESVVRT
jgi:hypothetical protein